VKYYLYISDAKVDMLISQIPHEAKKKIATEWKVDLKLLSASRKAESEPDDTRIARLEAVVSFIREYGDVGSVDAPGEYVADTLDMNWVQLRDSTGRARRSGIPGLTARGDSPDGPIVYFGARTERTYICLGGSRKYSLGNVEPSTAGNSSFAPALIAGLIAGLEWGGLEPETVPLDKVWMHGNTEDDKAFSDFTGKDLPLLAIWLAATGYSTVKQNLEFLAKRLIYRASPFADGSHCLLASPLYVALAE
jgi:hypothetical protein